MEINQLSVFQLLAQPLRTWLLWFSFISGILADYFNFTKTEELLTQVLQLL